MTWWMRPSGEEDQLHWAAAIRRHDIARRRTAGRVEEAAEVAADLAELGFGADGYPADYAGSKQLD